MLSITYRMPQQNNVVVSFVGFGVLSILIILVVMQIAQSSPGMHLTIVQFAEPPVVSQTLPDVSSQPPKVALPKGLSFETPYVKYAWDVATRAGISPLLFIRQINQESGFNPKASSPAGAIGIAQFMPSTAAGLSNPLGPGQLDPWNPEQALTAAALYMAAKVSAWGGDYAKALAAYNAGDGGVQRAMNKAMYAGRPERWREYLPQETQNYILIILGE